MSARSGQASRFELARREAGRLLGGEHRPSQAQLLLTNEQAPPTALTPKLSDLREQLAATRRQHEARGRSALLAQGIRVNAISAGPIKTLAASAIPGLGSKLKHHRAHTPLQKDTDQLEVGDAGVFLLSDMGRGVTGQVLYVDGGFSIMAG